MTLMHRRSYSDPDVPHEADWSTLALAEIEPNPDTRGVVYFDVWCGVCGQSGSFSVDIGMQEVTWV